jgi:hypothetical protein
VQLKTVLPVIVRDVVGILGAGLIVYGAWRASPVAGFVVCGIMLLFASTLLARGD